MSKLKALPPTQAKRRRLKAILYGRSGVGKTHFAMSFPNPYYCDIEGGGVGGQYQRLLKEAGGVYLPAEECSPSGLTDQIRALREEKHGFKTLIIDSATKLFQSAIAEEQERISAIGKVDGFGLSKKPAVALMRKLVLLTDKLDMNVLFICHEASEFVMVNGERTEVGKVPDVWDKLVYELDLTMHMTQAGSNRVLRVKKSRVEEMPEGGSHAATYDTLEKLIGAGLAAEAEPGEPLATDSQVAEIETLIARLGMKAEVVNQVLASCKARSWAEVTQSVIASKIETLKARVKE